MLFQGECIIGAGDSAGANLILATSLRCIEMGIPPPKGLFLAYAPMYLSLTMSPSRLLSMMDPLLPYGFMVRLLKGKINYFCYLTKFIILFFVAYICPNMSKNRAPGLSGSSSQNSESFEEISESDLVELQAHKSPTSDTDTLTYGSLSSQPEIEGKDENGHNIKVRDASVLETAHPTTSQQYVSDFLEKYVLGK